MQKSVRILAAAIALAALVTAIIWWEVARESRHGLLTVTFLNVGQGDSIFIEAPSGRQAIIDGGAGRAVLRELPKVMPWYDRSIDVMIGTHPDADHIGGLIDVLARYGVDYIVQSSVVGETPVWDAFVRAVDEEKDAKQIIANRGQIINLGQNAYIEILFPDRSVPRVETNMGCVVARLVYGNTAFMLSCDSPAAIEKYLVQLDGADLHSTVLKAGHHGSKTSSSPWFVANVNPEFVVYSRGCDNRYGHPSEETVATFAQFHIPTFDTCTDGAITFVSDGQMVRVR